MAPARAPLTLRDFLELACESSSDGFRSYPRCLPCDDRGARAPVRLLIEADLRRSPSRSPASSVFPKGPGALAKISHLSRSLSRRLREGFWRRREDDDGIDVDERDSLGLPSPVVSSCSASESSEYAESDTDLVTEEKTAPASASEPENMSSSSSKGNLDADGANAAGAGDGQKALDGEPVGRNSEMEDKQQLSPVSVMDFPFDDDDEEERSDAGTCSPSFQQCLADLERSKAQLAHKIRRFEGLARVVDPVELEARFATSESARSDETHLQSNSSTGSATTTTPRSDETHLQSNSSTGSATTTTPRSDETHLQSNSSTGSATTTTPRSDETHLQSNSSTGSATTTTPRSDERQSVDQKEHEPDEHRLLIGRMLKGTATWVATAEISERLLLDFFAEGVDRHRALAGSVIGTVKPSDDHQQLALARAAKEWVEGEGPQWGLEDVLFAGEAALADMERGQRWMCVGEEKRDVGAAVEGLVMDGLVGELVGDLVSAVVQWQ